MGMDKNIHDNPATSKKGGIFIASDDSYMYTRYAQHLFLTYLQLLA